jgi:hypothetical protein
MSLREVFFVDLARVFCYYINCNIYIIYAKMITTLKSFGTGQVTLPKAWREKFKTDHFIAQETSQGLLIKPLVEDGFYYEEDENSFGISFPLGIDAKELARNLEKANAEIRKNA